MTFQVADVQSLSPSKHIANTFTPLVLMARHRNTNTRCNIHHTTTSRSTGLSCRLFHVSLTFNFAARASFVSSSQYRQTQARQGSCSLVDVGCIAGERRRQMGTHCGVQLTHLYIKWLLEEVQTLEERLQVPIQLS